MRMPRPCAVEPHVRAYKISPSGFADATALCRGASRSPLQNKTSLTFPAEAQAPSAKSIKREALRRSAGASQRVPGLFVAASVILHGARPGHLSECCGLFIAASVKLHGARRISESAAVSL